MNIFLRCLNSWKQSAFHDKIVAVCTVIISVCTIFGTAIYLNQEKIMGLQLAQMQSGTRPWIGIVNSSKTDFIDLVVDAISDSGFVSFTLNWQDSIKNFGNYPAQNIRIKHVVFHQFRVDMLYKRSPRESRSSLAESADSIFLSWKRERLVPQVRPQPNSVLLFPNESYLHPGPTKTFGRFSAVAPCHAFDNPNTNVTAYILTRIDYSDQFDIPHRFASVRIVEVRFNGIKKRVLPPRTGVYVEACTIGKVSELKVKRSVSFVL